MCRYQNGKKVKASEYPGLEELCTVCGMCNDSSVDFNEVRMGAETENSNNNNRLKILCPVLSTLRSEWGQN